MTRKVIYTICALGVCAAVAYPVNQAVAASVQATITARVTTDNGSNGGEFALFLNGTPLPAVEEQTVTLTPADTLRAEVSASALSNPEFFSSSIRRDFLIEITLDEGTTAVVLESVLTAEANASTTNAAASGGSTFTCDFTLGGCSAPGGPGSIGFSSGVTSASLGGQSNSITINDVTTPTGRIGGPEVFAPLLTTLELARLPGQPSAQVTVGAAAQTLLDATASGSAVIEVSIVPLPAAAGLFGSALALVAWMRRRTSAAS